MKRFVVSFLAVGFVCGAAAAAPPAPQRVEMLDLRSIEGNVLSIGADTISVAVGAAVQSLKVADVQGVYLREADDLQARAGQAVVRTVAGDVLSADKLSASGGKLRFEVPAVGPVELPFTAVTCVYLPTSGMTVGAAVKRAAEVRPPAKPTDMLVVDQGKEWSGIEGVLVAVGDGRITFRLGEEDRQIEVRHVRAIRLAAPPAESAVAGRISLTDGSELVFSSIELSVDKLRVRTPAAGELSVPRAKVAGVVFASARVTELSSLQPAEAREHGLFDTTFPHRVNRSVSGTPLRLGGRTYPTGLGVSSFSELTYRLDGAYKSFVAVAGIDDAVRPLGDATLTFLGDGKELAAPLAVTGKGAPREVRLDVAGVKAFTIRVDFGGDKLPVGDHVDLCSARLIK